MEICCGNCEHFQGFELTCPSGIKSCLESNICYEKRGKHLKYYNNFAPKEDKMATARQHDKTLSNCNYCGKSIRMYEDCLCKKEDKMFLHGGLDKENKVEYKPTGKSLTARQVIAESKISLPETASLIQWARGSTISSMTNNLFLLPNFLDYAMENGCFRDFLIGGGYIEKVEEEWVSPKMGDRFTHRGRKYRLHRVSESEFTLFSGDGNRVESPVKTKNSFNITKEEFQQICGSIPVDELERI